MLDSSANIVNFMTLTMVQLFIYMSLDTGECICPSNILVNGSIFVGV